MCYVVLFLQSFLFSGFCVDGRLKMHIFGASSFSAAIQSLPGGVFRRRQHLTALPGLHLNHLSAKFSQKILQFQLHQLFRLRHTTKSPPSRLQIIIWHDVINNSLTPHSSNYHKPLSPEALMHTLSAFTLQYCGNCLLPTDWFPGCFSSPPAVLSSFTPCKTSTVSS